MNKLALGTVQFGLNYGINNPQGQVDESEVTQILDYAITQGIDCLDTAYAYGQSEAVLGKYLAQQSQQFKVISKFPVLELLDYDQIFLTSLARLNLTAFYGYLFHDYKIFKAKPELWKWFKALKQAGKVQKIGFSLYYPQDLIELLDQQVEFDLLQIPYSIFDQRFAEYLPILQQKGVEVHVRSVFLQGLVFKNLLEINAFFEKFKPKLAKLHQLSLEHHIPIAALCLNFALLTEDINKVVIGVDSKANLEEHVGSAEYLAQTRVLLPELQALAESNEQFILPVNWKF